MHRLAIPAPAAAATTADATVHLGSGCAAVAARQPAAFSSGHVSVVSAAAGAVVVVDRSNATATDSNDACRRRHPPSSDPCHYADAAASAAVDAAVSVGTWSATAGAHIGSPTTATTAAAPTTATANTATTTTADWAVTTGGYRLNSRHPHHSRLVSATGSAPDDLVAVADCNFVVVAVDAATAAGAHSGAYSAADHENGTLFSSIRCRRVRQCSS
jgi:hypothetical protein